MADRNYYSFIYVFDLLNKGPLVSVIITAHDRKDFLLDAVNSVLRQTADRSLYEIIVVKSFKDLTIDRFLANNDVLNIYVNSASGGEKFVAGINKSKGGIISFLDDDDLFREDKIEYVVKVFSNGNTGFFHNGIDIVDDQGNPLKIDSPALSKTPLIVKDRLAGNSIEILLRRGAWFNSSSISMRKGILISKINYLAKISAVTDSFLLYSALSTDCTILLDPIPLTTYKVHNSLSNFAGKFEEFVPAKTFLYRRSLQDFSVISDMLANTPYLEYAKAEGSRVKFELGIVANYREMRPNIIDFIRIFNKPCHIRLHGSLFLMAAYVTSIFSRHRAVKMLFNYEKGKFKKA